MTKLGGILPVMGLALLCIATQGACSSDHAGDTDGGDGDLGDGQGMPVPFGGVTFPWPVFDGNVPDVPVAAAPGRTWYCDPVNGDDRYDGTSATFVSGNVGPKKTISAVLTKNAEAGDTLLLAGGIYRERPDFNSATGKADAPITIGSYGRGTGAPIIDGGLAPATWTRYTARGQKSVWQMSTASLARISSTIPVLGIYVHSGSVEAALREVPHGQLVPYPNNPLPPNQTQDDITDNSSHWYFDAAGKMLYADFGGTLGNGDPNNADISILYNSENASGGHEPIIVLSQGHGYFRFVGLTLRAGSWHGAYSETSGNVFDHCDVRFNGGGGIAFDATSGDLTVTGNGITNSRIWMNVLHNWPRFNNGNTGGGWPGATGWYSQSNVLVEGNVIYGNGGEGLVLWGTNGSGTTAHVSMKNVARHNVVFDNWSVNVYLDNTQNAIVEENLVFDHPRDPTQTFDNLLTLSNGYNTDFGRRMTPINISLADEPGSAFDSQAHLSNITVINNIFAGGSFGFVDYDDGTQTVFHGLKSCVIANNTWVLGSVPFPSQDSYAWRHGFAGSHPDSSSNSLVENNIIVAPVGFFLQDEQSNDSGITNDYNLYGGAGSFATNTATNQSFTDWKAAHPTWDQHSFAADAMLADSTEFSRTAADKPVYDWAKAMPQAGSPAIGAGNRQSTVTADFTGATRSGTNLGAVAPH